ncbi:MAG: hypothetical protein WC827_03505 [Candidatus Paceibacterota bacterium]|jgi:hypothetical protein
MNKTCFDIKSFMQKLIGELKVSSSDEDFCFLNHGVCRNFLPILQDCLEDANISLEEFCLIRIPQNCMNGDIGKFFVLKRGRIRLVEDGPGTKMSLSHVRQIIQKVYKK